MRVKNNNLVENFINVCILQNILKNRVSMFMKVH